MPISDGTRSELVRRLLKDIETTLGPGHEGVVQASIQGAPRELTDLAEYSHWVVEDVQQFFHDCYVDTTWPRCPRHLQHPLWLRTSGGTLSWHCERDNVPIAMLGELDQASTR